MEVYNNLFFYLTIIIFIFSVIVIVLLKKRLIIKQNERKLIQQQHTAKIDMIRKDHSNTLEKLRVLMLEREEDRNHQWIESEKETLFVLSGVSNLLDLSEKINKVEIDKILKLLKVIESHVEKIN